MAPPIMDSTTRFARAQCFGTSASGTSDAILFGVLQDLTIDIQNALEELMGPTQNTAVSVARKDVKVTGTFSTGSFDLGLAKQCVGGTLSVTGGITKLVGGMNDDLPKFDIHAYSGATGATAANSCDFKLYGCVASNYKTTLKLNTMQITDGTLHAYGNGTKIYEWLNYGDQTAT